MMPVAARGERCFLPGPPSKRWEAYIYGWAAAELVGAHAALDSRIARIFICILFFTPQGEKQYTKDRVHCYRSISSIRRTTSVAKHQAIGHNQLGAVELEIA